MPLNSQPSRKKKEFFWQKDLYKKTLKPKLRYFSNYLGVSELAEFLKMLQIKLHQEIQK